MTRTRLSFSRQKLSTTSSGVPRGFYALEVTGPDLWPCRPPDPASAGNNPWIFALLERVCEGPALDLRVGSYRKRHKAKSNGAERRNKAELIKNLINYLNIGTLPEIVKA